MTGSSGSGVTETWPTKGRSVAAIRGTDAPPTLSVESSSGAPLCYGESETSRQQADGAGKISFRLRHIFALALLLLAAHLSGPAWAQEAAGSANSTAGGFLRPSRTTEVRGKEQQGQREDMSQTEADFAGPIRLLARSLALAVA